jgi:hypothetical protein
MVSFTVAAAALTYGLIRGAWASGETIALFAVAVVAVLAFVVTERRSAAPMLDLGLLKNPVFLAMVLAGSLLSAAAWAAMTYQSLWFQSVLGQNSSWPVVIPGLVLVGIGAGLAMASLTSTAMAAVPGPRAGMAGGALNAFRQLGYAFGIAVLGEVFRSGLTHAAGPDLSAR